jgi:hypothetical protein
MSCTNLRNKNSETAQTKNTVRTTNETPVILAFTFLFSTVMRDEVSSYYLCLARYYYIICLCVHFLFWWRPIRNSVFAVRNHTEQLALCGYVAQLNVFLRPNYRNNHFCGRPPTPPYSTPLR